MGDFAKPNEVSDNRTFEMPSEQLSEEEIGMTQYISDHEGFSGIVKYRFSDFQVSEINLKGEVAKLTDTTAPSPPKPDEILEDEELILNKYNLEILPKQIWDQLNTMVEDKDYSEIVKIDVTSATKEIRTGIHNAVKNAFGSALVGSTVTENDMKYIQFKRYKHGDRIDKRVKWPWPGEYVYFLLHKSNCDTMEAASRLSETMRSHIKPQMFAFAGTKDRRAITTQWFCIRKVEPNKILHAASFIRNIEVGNFTFHNEVLKLGMLKGNLFRIAIRNVTASEETIAKACNSLKENGFINYYGQQRFGSRKEVPTYMVGKHLLRGDFETAIECVFASQEGRSPRGVSTWEPARHHHVRQGGGRDADKQYLPSRWERYFNRFPRHSPEGRMLAVLTMHPNDHCGAFNAVPRNLRLLYLNSYQSFLWNRAVSERLERLGLQPAPGDLVLANPDEFTDEPQEHESDTESKDTSTTSQTSSKFQARDMEVLVVTEEDIESGRYTIFDIVMPLPGYRVMYPPNMVDFYTLLVEDDSLTLSLNRNRHVNYTLAGTYRHIVRRPRRVTWALAAYSAPRAALLASDHDLLNGAAPDGIDPAGGYRALLLTFSLPPSSYATVLLRELLKADTSSSAQAQRNHYFHEPEPSAANKREHESDPDAAKKIKLN